MAGHKKKYLHIYIFPSRTTLVRNGRPAEPLDDAPHAAAGFGVGDRCWMSEDARGLEGCVSSGATAREEGDALKGAGEGSWNTVVQAAAGMRALARRSVGATSPGEEEEGGCSCWCGGGVTAAAVRPPC
jgi:hypothetical protein